MINGLGSSANFPVIGTSDEALTDDDDGDIGDEDSITIVAGGNVPPPDQIS